MKEQPHKVLRFLRKAYYLADSQGKDFQKTQGKSRRGQGVVLGHVILTGISL